MEITIRKAIRISAAHQIPNHPGKCKNLHGHNYLIEAWMKGAIDEETGMVVDFGEMAQDLEMVVGLYDHTYLNEACSGVPITTAEYLAVFWLDVLYTRNPSYTRLRVWETDDSYAEATI